MDAALGTQTIASVARPAAFCGIAGLAPTFGRVDRAGVDLYAPSVDVVGAFAKDVPTLDRVARAILDDYRTPDPYGRFLPRKLLLPTNFVDAACAPEAKRWFGWAVTYVFRADIVSTGRGETVSATWIVREDESRRRRGRDADVPRRPAAGTSSREWATPSPSSEKRPAASTTSRT